MTSIYQKLFEATPHPYLIVRPDAAFTIVAVNDRYLAATGTKRAAIVGRGLFDVFPDNPEDRAGSGVSDLRASLLRVVRDGMPDTMGVQKYDIPRRGGAKAGFEVRYWSPVNTPVFGPDGRIAWIIHHVEDITEFILSREQVSRESAERVEKVEARAERMKAEILRRAAEVKDSNRKLKAAMEELERREAELARLNACLKELDRAKTEFFANVSHEFRTPLTLMLGPIEELLERPSGLPLPPEDGRCLLEIAYRNALRMLKLVNALLDFSRIEAGRANPVWQATDLAAYTAGLASHFRPLCERAGLKLTVDCPPLPQPVEIDRDMWEKIILNLLSNAFKFTFRGGIEVRLRAAEGQAELSVADTGTGIPERELPHLFERFHRIAGVQGRSYEGTGIGLALVRDLARLHGGGITVESEEGRGSRFTVRIPLGAVYAGERSAPAAEAPRPLAQAYLQEARQWLPDDGKAFDAESGAAAATGKRGHVVVVDDNADMRTYIRGLLQEAGYGVTALEDAATALEQCRAEPPDLLLSDIMLPGMDGMALLERIRGSAATAGLPVILLSARAGEEARVAGLSAGADDYLVKPFPAKELVARVEGMIRLAQVRREADESLRQAAAVFSNTAEGIVVTDPDRRILAINPAYSRITGYAPEEVLGRTPWLVRSGRHDEAFYENMMALLASTGQWQGEIWNKRKNGEIYPAWENISIVRDERGRLTHYVAIFSDISAIKEAEARMTHLAHHDALTGLPNRVLFAANLDKAIAHAKRHGRKVGMFLLDLDRFKLINDTLGHDAGDQLLCTTARRLLQCVRAEDTVARLGGDEFAIVVNDLADAQGAEPLASKIIQAVAEPMTLSGKEIVSSTSIGISLYPDDASNAEDLVKTADAAMYRAKAGGRHTYAFYTAEITAAAAAHLAIESGVRQALALGQFELHYQPQIALPSEEIVGVEALLR